jgi:hypothetical protein
MFRFIILAFSSMTPPTSNVLTSRACLMVAFIGHQPLLDASRRAITMGVLIKRRAGSHAE